MFNRIRGEVSRYFPNDLLDGKILGKSNSLSWYSPLEVLLKWPGTDPRGPGQLALGPHVAELRKRLRLAVLTLPGT